MIPLLFAVDAPFSFIGGGDHQLHAVAVLERHENVIQVFIESSHGASNPFDGFMRERVADVYRQAGLKFLHSLVWKTEDKDVFESFAGRAFRKAPRVLQSSLDIY
jgi:hypothetical protein